MRYKSAILVLLLVTLCGCSTSYGNPVDEDVFTTTEESEVVDTRILYELNFDEASYYILADGRLFPSAETKDAELYRNCYNPISMWYDDTEILISPKVRSYSDYNSFTYKNIVFITSDTSFDFDKIKDLIVEKTNNDVLVFTDYCKLRGNTVDTLYTELFPGYDAEDVYSYAKAELSDGTPIAVLQRVSSEGVNYEFLGVDSSLCNLTPSSQLVVGDSDEVIELEFSINPNYIPR